MKCRTNTAGISFNRVCASIWAAGVVPTWLLLLLLLTFSQRAAATSVAATENYTVGILQEASSTYTSAFEALVPLAVQAIRRRTDLRGVTVAVAAPSLVCSWLHCGGASGFNASFNKVSGAHDMFSLLHKQALFPRCPLCRNTQKQLPK